VTYQEIIHLEQTLYWKLEGIPLYCTLLEWWGRYAECFPAVRPLYAGRASLTLALWTVVWKRNSDMNPRQPLLRTAPCRSRRMPYFHAVSQAFSRSKKASQRVDGEQMILSWRSPHVQVCQLSYAIYGNRHGNLSKRHLCQETKQDAHSPIAQMSCTGSQLKQSVDSCQGQWQPYPAVR
jgi:hypothetical protein